MCLLIAGSVFHLQTSNSKIRGAGERYSIVSHLLYIFYPDIFFHYRNAVDGIQGCWVVFIVILSGLVFDGSWAVLQHLITSISSLWPVFYTKRMFLVDWQLSDWKNIWGTSCTFSFLCPFQFLDFQCIDLPSRQLPLFSLPGSILRLSRALWRLKNRPWNKELESICGVSQEEIESCSALLWDFYVKHYVHKKSKTVESSPNHVTVALSVC